MILDRYQRRLLAAGAADHQHLAMVAASPSWAIGQTWWLGDACLLCTGIDRHGSHQSDELCRYDAATHTSHCPRCGCELAWSEAPAVHDLPWCQPCSDLDALRDRVEEAMRRWDDADYDARHEGAWMGPAYRRGRAMLAELHRAEEAYQEILGAVAAREDALEECPATLRGI